MFKPFVILLSLLMTSSLLNGCALTKTNNEKDVCTKMKRELIYQSNNLNREAVWTTQSQKENYKQKMRDANCL
ncbi:MAG: hypothetical protein LEGION0398_MBIBDBAK_01137 [Legionellaceae bacterium]